MSCSADRIADMPSHTKGWSSTTKTLITKYLSPQAEAAHNHLPDHGVCAMPSMNHVEEVTSAHTAFQGSNYPLAVIRDQGTTPSRPTLNPKSASTPTTINAPDNYTPPSSTTKTIQTGYPSQVFG